MDRVKHTNDNRMKHLTGAGVKCKCEGRNSQVTLSLWQIHLSQQAGQLKEPGIYPMTLVVGQDGKRTIVLGNGTQAKLG